MLSILISSIAIPFHDSTLNKTTGMRTLLISFVSIDSSMELEAVSKAIGRKVSYIPVSCFALGCKNKQAARNSISHEIGYVAVTTLFDVVAIHVYSTMCTPCM